MKTLIGVAILLLVVVWVWENHPGFLTGKQYGYNQQNPYAYQSPNQAPQISPFTYGQFQDYPGLGQFGQPSFAPPAYEPYRQAYPPLYAPVCPPHREVVLTPYYFRSVR